MAWNTLVCSENICTTCWLSSFHMIRFGSDSKLGIRRSSCLLFTLSFKSNLSHCHKSLLSSCVSSSVCCSTRGKGVKITCPTFAPVTWLFHSLHKAQSADYKLGRREREKLIILEPVSAKEANSLSRARNCKQTPSVQSPSLKLR